MTISTSRRSRGTSAWALLIVAAGATVTIGWAILRVKVSSAETQVVGAPVGEASLTARVIIAVPTSSTSTVAAAPAVSVLGRTDVRSETQVVAFTGSNAGNALLLALFTTTLGAVFVTLGRHRRNVAATPSPSTTPTTSGEPK